MLYSLRRRLSYANVAATLALFVALGGTSYAALTITGKNVRNSSLTGSDVKNSSLTTSDIKNSSLLSRDFKAGELPTGPKGDKGDPGPTGAPGSPGTAGPANIVTRLSSVSAPVGVNDFSVACQAGERAVGGGGTGPSADPEVTLAGTFPSPATAGTTPTGWTARYNVTGIAHTVVTYVVCVSG